MDHLPQGRRVGLSRTVKLGYSLHERVRTENTRHQTPEDVEAPPRGSSDEESPDTEFEDPRPNKKRKTSQEEVGDNKGFVRSSSTRLVGGELGELPSEPSNIQISSFSTSQRVNVDGYEEDPFFGSQGKTSQSRKTKTYAKNIHTASKEVKEEKPVERSRYTRLGRKSNVLRAHDTDSMCAKADLNGSPNRTHSGFRQPTKVPMTQSPRLLRTLTRSSGGADSSPQAKPATLLQNPSAGVDQGLFPARRIIKTDEELIDLMTPPGAKAQSMFRAPLQPRDGNGPGTADNGDLVEQETEERTASSKAKISDASITSSSFPSISYPSGSSPSPGSAPSSPGSLEATLETLCPVCKKVVDRSSLEEYNHGKRLRSRDQLRFCKTHRVQSAKSEWTESGFPAIDWQFFDERLKEYHPAIDEILKGVRRSYYRNAFKDMIKSKKFRTMREAYHDSESTESLSPGYYGSKGARAMIENIAAAFASKIRRLAVSDQVITTAGVAAYIQAVLVPELATLLVMDDMKVDEEGARAILRDTVEIGNLVNEEEDEVVEPIDMDAITEPPGEASFVGVISVD